MRYFLSVLLICGLLISANMTVFAQGPTETPTPGITEPPPLTTDAVATESATTTATATATAAPEVTPTPSSTPISTTTPEPVAGELAPIQVSLEELGYNTITIQGAFGSAQIYVPLPPGWEATRDAEMSIDIASSPLLKNISNMTVLVNNQPVASTTLGVNGSTQSISFSIPASLVAPPGILIQFQGYLRVTDETCEDSNIPSQWARVLGDSHLTLYVRYNDDLSQLDDLASLLYSRALDGTPHGLLFVLPDTPDAITLSTAVQVAAGLGNFTSDHTYPVSVMVASEVTVDDLSNSNVVLLGLPQDQPWIGALTGDLVTLDTDEQFYTLDEAAVPGDDAVFEILRSPWNKANHVLVISANDIAGLETAGTVFLDYPTVRSLNGNFMFSSGPVPVSNDPLAVPWSEQQTTLEELGLGARTVRGAGIFSEYYTIYRQPGMVFDRGTQFVLRGTASTLLDNSESYIAVFLNETPLGTYPTQALIENQALAFRIPTVIDEKSLQQQLNLRIEMSNQVANEQCQTMDRDNAWVQLDNSSFFEVNGVQLPLPDLKAFPYPFAAGGPDDPVLLVLPDDLAPQYVTGAVQLSWLLGFAAPGDIAIDAVTLSKFDETQYDNHLVFLLDGATATEIDALFAAEETDDTAATPEPLSRFDSDSLALLDLSLYTDLDNPYGLVFTDVSPVQSDRTILLLVSDTAPGVATTVAGLSYALPPVAVSGTVALVQKGQYPYVLYDKADIRKVIDETNVTNNAAETASTAGEDAGQDENDVGNELTSLDASVIIIIVPIAVALTLILAIWAFQRRTGAQ